MVSCFKITNAAIETTLKVSLSVHIFALKAHKSVLSIRILSNYKADEFKHIRQNSYTLHIHSNLHLSVSVTSICFQCLNDPCFFV